MNPVDSSEEAQKADFGIYHHTDAEGSERTRARVARLFSTGFARLSAAGHIPRHVLDAGSGACFVTHLVCSRYQAAHVTCADTYSGDSLHYGGAVQARRNVELLGHGSRVCLVRADLRALPFPSSSFDTAVTSLVFHNIHKGLDDAVSELSRVLTAKGTVLFGDLFFPGSSMKETLLSTFRLLEEYSLGERYLKHYSLLLLSRG